MEFIVSEVEKIVGQNAGHGMDHIFAVLGNCKKMIQSDSSLSNDQIIIIQLAALLHDVDDHKFFTDTSHAQMILEKSQFAHFQTEVLFCISLVGYSSNQNQFPSSVPLEFNKYGFNRIYFEENGKFADSDLWILYPRWADRLEAIDLGRALEFGRSRGRPDFDENTPPVRSLDDFRLIDFNSLERDYIKRGCKSHPDHNTSMDHVYEKCMNLIKMDTKNDWCEREKMIRHSNLMNDIVNFWNKIY